MNKTVFCAALALAASASPALADEGGVEPYIGVTLGYHDVSFSDGVTYGVVAGVDVPVSGKFVVGVEGNYNRGTKGIDSEYGLAAKFGYNVSDRAQIFVRAGYQQVDFDISKILGVPAPAGTDDTDGNYLVGIGAQYKVTPKTSLRLAVDTISFDTTRVTAAVLVGF